MATPSENTIWGEPFSLSAKRASGAGAGVPRAMRTPCAGIPASDGPTPAAD